MIYVMMPDKKEYNFVKQEMEEGPDEIWGFEIKDGPPYQMIVIVIFKDTPG